MNPLFILVALITLFITIIPTHATSAGKRFQRRSPATPIKLVATPIKLAASTRTTKTTTTTTTAAPTSAYTPPSFPNVPATTGTATQPPTDADRQDCLAAHNAVRAGIPSYTKPRPLTWSTTLEEAACAWSKYLADSGKFEHSGGKLGRYGENLYKSWGSKPRSSTAPGSCRPAVTSWASESQNYTAGRKIDSGFA
ncbi:hypothetical protein HK104_007399 [Borealophlyctis nickersoniae]|nr:hypothetical protein HK104_007399 [Borealophlyctis nickersoniae]